jgi:putative oxidoreductase
MIVYRARTPSRTILEDHPRLDWFERFAVWDIPYPHFNAALSAYTEFIGGWLTVFGLGTRLISIPMIVNMLLSRPG